MRIISGLYRGHRLVNFKAGHIRPTTDREKETIFNKLMNVIDGSIVLDLFSGTGNLGLEALSRGASHVSLVEKHPKSQAIIKQNLQQLKVTEGVKLYAQDVFSFLKKHREPQFNVILIDPPFTQSLAHSAMEALAHSPVAAPGATVVIESSAQERIDEEYMGYKLLDRKEFGDKRVSFFEKSE